MGLFAKMKSETELSLPPSHRHFSIFDQVPLFPAIFSVEETTIIAAAAAAKGKHGRDETTTIPATIQAATKLHN